MLGHKNWPQGEFYEDAKAQSSIAVKYSYAFSSGALRAVFAKRKHFQTSALCKFFWNGAAHHCTHNMALVTILYVQNDTDTFRMALIVTRTAGTRRMLPFSLGIAPQQT